MVPVNEFPTKPSLRRFFALPMLVGKAPPMSALSKIITSSSLGMLNNDDGRVPFIGFDDMSKTSRNLRSPIDSGMVPVMLLSSILRRTRPLNLVISDGRNPARPFSSIESERSITTICFSAVYSLLHQSNDNTLTELNVDIIRLITSDTLESPVVPTANVPFREKVVLLRP